MKRRPRNTGTVLRDGSGWAVRYGPHRSRKYESGFRTKSEAERRLALLHAEQVHGRLGVAADPRLMPTLDELSKPWLEVRKLTKKAGKEDEYRWRAHIAPDLGSRKPPEVTQDTIHDLVQKKRIDGLAGGTMRVVVSLLSRFYEDHRRFSPVNPCVRLPDRTLELLRSDHDPKAVPFVERLDDVKRIYLALEEEEPPCHIGYALGAYAGLRPSESFAIRWPRVDLDRRRIHIVESTSGALPKDRESRIAPITDTLHRILRAWHLKTGGTGLLCPPLRKDGKKIDKGTRGDALRRVLVALQLARPGFGLPSDAMPIAKQDLWYWCTRHTFASQWIMAGRPLEELQKILGHASLAETERYAHLRPDFFRPGVEAVFTDDVRPGSVSVAQFGSETAAPATATTRNC